MCFVFDSVDKVINIKIKNVGDQPLMLPAGIQRLLMSNSEQISSLANQLQVFMNENEKLERKLELYENAEAAQQGSASSSSGQPDEKRREQEERERKLETERREFAEEKRIYQQLRREEWERELAEARAERDRTAARRDGEQEPAREIPPPPGFAPTGMALSRPSLRVSGFMSYNPDWNSNANKVVETDNSNFSDNESLENSDVDNLNNFETDNFQTNETAFEYNDNENFGNFENDSSNVKDNFDNEEKFLFTNALHKIVERLEKPLGTVTKDSALIEKDSTKFEYFLTNKKNYQMWFSIFQTEIGLKRLEDIIDETVTPFKAFSSAEMLARKKIVRGIILAHIDETYQEQVLNLSEPLKMLQKLEKLKRDEINDTTVSIKDQLRQLAFKIGTETVYDFNLKFDELIRKYQVVAGHPMSELDKRDAYYHIVSKVIPSIKEATYRDVAKGQGEGYTFEEMKRYVQKYEAENKSVLQNRARNAVMGAFRQNMGRGLRPGQLRDDRCYNCGRFGHFAPNCPKPEGEYFCYNCQGYGHRGFECPEPDHRLDGQVSRSAKRPNTFPYPNFNKRGRQSRCRSNYGRRGRGGGRQYQNRGARRGYRGGGRQNRNYGRPFYNNYNQNQNQNQRFQSRGSNRPGRGGRSRNYRGDRKINYNQVPPPAVLNQGDNSRTGVTENKASGQNQINILSPRINVQRVSDSISQVNEQLSLRESVNLSGLSNEPLWLQKLKQNKNSNNDDDGPAAKRICMMRQSMPDSSGKSINKSLFISFLGDSGACDHVVKNLSVLHSFENKPENIKSANKNEHADLHILGIGELYLKSNFGAQKPFVLTGVKYCPDIAENVLSVSKFADLGYRTDFGDTDFTIYHKHTKEILLVGNYESPSWITSLEIIPPEKN